MHVSTSSGKEGDSAWLETDKMSPTRKCHVQCLQFFYYHSGSESDQLNIWIREFQDERNSTGNLRLMGQITGNENREKSIEIVFYVIWLLEKAGWLVLLLFDNDSVLDKSSNGFWDISMWTICGPSIQLSIEKNKKSETQRMKSNHKQQLIKALFSLFTRRWTNLWLGVLQGSSECC